MAWLNIALSPNTWIGAALAAVVVMAWALLWHGPGQYEAGGLAMAAKLDAATNQAIGELEDEAEAAAFRFAQCINRGPEWMYLNASGECVQRKAP